MRKVYILILMAFLTSLSYGQNVGDVIITEIMQNPNAVSDGDGEWFEVYNTTNSEINLKNWILSDDNSDTEKIEIPTDLLIPIGGFLFFARNGDASVNGRLPTPDFIYGSSISLGNGTDGLKLIHNYNVIDSVRWDGGKIFPFPSGQSMTLRSDKMNTDDNLFGYNWCSGTTMYGDGDKGTPGASNDDCVACVAEGAVIISEIMQNPAAVGDTKGEWFELYNTTDADISLKNWRVIDDNKTEEGFKVDTLVDGTEAIIKAKSYLSFCVNHDISTNGGINPDVYYKYADLTLGNGKDGMMLYCNANLVDIVVWDGGPEFPDPNGSSMSLLMDKHNHISNNDGASWEEATAVYGDGDLGTPGEANGEALSLAKNEIEGISIYPNPVAFGSFVITSNNTNLKEIYIYNILGSQVFRKSFNSNKLEVNISNLDSGLYLVRVVEGINMSVNKLVIQ